jgi:hypothetical protein
LVVRCVWRPGGGEWVGGEQRLYYY